MDSDYSKNCTPRFATLSARPLKVYATFSLWLLSPHQFRGFVFHHEHFCRYSRSDLLLCKHSPEICPSLDLSMQAHHEFYTKLKRHIRAGWQAALKCTPQPQCLFHLYWASTYTVCSQNYLVYLALFALGYSFILVWFAFSVHGWTHKLRMP